MTHYIVPWSPLTQPAPSYWRWFCSSSPVFCSTSERASIIPWPPNDPDCFSACVLPLIFLLSALTFLVAATIEGRALLQQLGGGPVIGPGTTSLPLPSPADSWPFSLSCT